LRSTSPGLISPLTGPISPQGSIRAGRSARCRRGDEPATAACRIERCRTKVRME
jgi:hypothetical protein